MDNRRDQYLKFAEELLKSGTRPSADMLVHACGGSKQTALAVLNDFWQSYVPGILSGAGDFDPKIPFEVREAAKAMWSSAATAANSEAQVIYAGLKVDLAIQTEIAEKARAGLAEAMAATASLQEEMAEAVSQVESLTKLLHTAQGEANDLRTSYDEAMAHSRNLQDELAQSRAEQVAERAQNVESLRVVTEALKEAHAREMADLRSENTMLHARLDSLREECNQAIAHGQQPPGQSPFRSRLRTARRVQVKSAV